VLGEEQVLKQGQALKVRRMRRVRQLLKVSEARRVTRLWKVALRKAQVRQVPEALTGSTATWTTPCRR